MDGGGTGSSDFVVWGRCSDLYGGAAVICMAARRVVRRQPLALLALLISVATLWVLSLAFDPRCQCTDDALTDDEARRCRCGPDNSLLSCHTDHCRRPVQTTATLPCT